MLPDVFNCTELKNGLLLSSHNSNAYAILSIGWKPTLIYLAVASALQLQSNVIFNLHLWVSMSVHPF